MPFQRQKQLKNTSRGYAKTEEKTPVLNKIFFFFKEATIAEICCSCPNSGLENIPKLHILQVTTSHAEGRSVSRKRQKNNFSLSFLSLFLFFICSCSLFLLHLPLSSFLLLSLPSSHTSLASFPLSIPFSVFRFIPPSAFVSLSLFCMYCQPVSPFLPPGAVGQLCG